VNLTFIFFVPIVVALLILLVWALRKPESRNAWKVEPGSLEQPRPRHATYLSLIRQALSPADLEFLAARGSPVLARRVRKERRRVALSYLKELRNDFQRLLRLAQVIASLSPEVGAAQEWERLRLSLRFSFRYQIVWAGLYSGLLVLPQLSGLSQLVSELAFRMETAMKELGERAVLAAKLASSSDGSGVDIA
jgi:hypothetical protein